ncbi:telomerase protein component 1-like [Hoplias malabaricus]|uniref:telomerase protein component 1-like n=1 Tax=Hoplias malabaricus TaxID=27720 RepID=UPI0034622AF3
MKAATLIPSDTKSEMEKWGYSNWTGPNLPQQTCLENRILAQASTVLLHTHSFSPSWTLSSSISSCPSLQPSNLSSISSSSPLLSSTSSSSPPLSSTSSSSPLLTSTTSSSPLLTATTTFPPLFSTSSSHLISSTSPSHPLLSSISTSSSSHPLLSSPLLTTENTQLKSVSLSFSSSLTSFPPLSIAPLLHTGAPPDVHPADNPCTLSRKRKLESVSVSSIETLCPSEELDKDLENEAMVEMDSALPTELLSEPPVLDLRLGEAEEKQTLDLGEDFAVVKPHSNKKAEALKEKKYILLNVVCCSLVNKTIALDSNDWTDKENVWTKLKDLGTEITLTDPEFILKVAVYTRQELNIRITANFLLALAAHLPQSKAHLRRYFCAAMQLPSDWLEVTRIYSMCFSSSLPSCLKKALVDKFKQFSEYQLAKYNTRKHRCKHSKKKKSSAQQPSEEQWQKWADLVRADTNVLKKFWQMSERPAVDKKQSEFNMKKLIKRLHIRDPAEMVMGILGKRYPSDLRAFVRSGLSGVWQSQRAGQRMRLKQPNTWETKLSLEGNKAETWEKLIDSNSLPFMAMLRNLRNMVTQGISEKHHERILNRLTSKSAVIQSRQFPFRFLSAYKVILQLDNFEGGPAKRVSSCKEILQGILKRIPKSRRFRTRSWDTAGRKRLRAILGIPVIYRMYNMKRKAQTQTARVERYTPELLQRYRQALEKAVQISCRYNIPPLSGHTIIIFTKYWDTDSSWKGAGDICIPPDASDSTDKPDLSATPREAALLLSVMISSCCEHPIFLLADDTDVQEVTLKSHVFLENVRQLSQQLSDQPGSSENIPLGDFFSKLIEEKTKVDNIVMLDDRYLNWNLSKQIDSFQKKTTSDPLVVTILLRSSMGYRSNPGDTRSVYLYGFSEQILRFVSERGSSRLLDHIEKIDKLRNIPPPAGGAAKPEKESEIVPLLQTPKLRWRGVRVFISSTFRDMNSERDVLVRSVFPELRRRAAPHCLYLQEVELRWGVTEEESSLATQLCLTEVCRSQMLLGILGERYGQVPPRPVLPDLPQYSWLNSTPDGLSITEMEIRQFQALYSDSAQSRMFFYFRSPNLANSVPVDWRGDFTSESSESAAKMKELKTWIRSNQFKITENYSCEWGGVVDGKPCVKGLEEFARAVLEDLWAALERLFIEDEDETDLTSEIRKQEVHQEVQQRHFHGRAKLVLAAMEKVEECQKRGGILLVDGSHGDGKTAFMAGLAHALQTPDKHRKHPVCDVISYSTAASQSASSVKHLLRCLVQWLRRKKEQEEELPTSTPYRELLSELLSHLSEPRKGRALAVLVDGADVVRDAQGQVSEWIPERIPKGLCLVLSVTKDSALGTTLSKKKGSVWFPLSQLSLPDRREIVQKELSVYGKKLSDSAFNNQLQTLLMKKGAASPSYLHLACEELRNYASFQTMKENLQTLPGSLCELVQFALTRLQTQSRVSGLDWALAALTVSSTGLRERDLYSLLNLCRDLSSTQSPFTWDQALKHARNPKSRVPMAIFSQLAQSLHSLIHPSFSYEPDEPLTLTNPHVRSAFEQLYISTEEDRARAHLILAVHLWVRSDPHSNDTYLHCDADTLVHLPTHLMLCGQLQPVCYLLTNYYFLFANVRHGLLHPLLETYIKFKKAVEAGGQCWPEASGDLKELQTCQIFLKRHAPLLSDWPALFVQQALNEWSSSSAHRWAQGLVEEGGINAVRKLNSAEGLLQENGELMSTFQWGPSCVALSPTGQCVAVGTEQGTLHFIHIHTNQEVKSLVSNCDGISGCVFLGDSAVGTTSYDGQVEVWDISSGCRTAHLNAHSNTITACDVSSDRKHFATVSLDSNLKVWSSQKRKQVASLLTPGPLNCVKFDAEGGLLAVGCWDGAVRVWDFNTQEKYKTLSGHHSSVRSVSFSPSSSSLLCSGDLNGEVLLWSLQGKACVGRYKAHCGSTEALAFLPGGETLLTAGHDGMVQLWSGGLGRSVSVLGEETKLFKPSVRAAAVSEDAALSVAVANGYAAVGYHGNGLKIFNLDSGERVWCTETLRVSVPCVLWLDSGAAEDPELLLCGALDHHLRLWSRQGADMTLRGTFGVQKGGILALAQNSTYIASASDDFTIALWLKSAVTTDPWVCPGAVSVLRGHSGGVTCLAFSPNGDQLLSGGKDKGLMVWNVNSSPPGLSRSLPHSHGDWITGCAWTPTALMSCSSDCRLKMWDIQNGHCLREVSAAASLSSLSYWEDYIMLGCADGLLMVWKADLGVIAEIQAHQSRLHHTTIITKPDGASEHKPEELMLATASDDGTVKLWLPLQVQHRSTLLGHSGAIQALVSGQDSQFLTVSQDRSLRAWSAQTESRPLQVESLSAMCFVAEELLVCGYSSGKLEIYHHTSLLYSNKVHTSRIRAVASLPEEQLAVGCGDHSVTLFKLERDPQSDAVSLSKVKSYEVNSNVDLLRHCNALLGVCVDSTVIAFATEPEDHGTKTVSYSSRFLRVCEEDVNGLWLLGEEDNELQISFVLCTGPELSVSTCNTSLGRDSEDNNDDNDEVKEGKKEENETSIITAAAISNELAVCGDSKGNMWFHQFKDGMKSSARRSALQAHSDRISVLRLTDSTIVSASFDRTVKLWDRDTKKQVGVFVCGAAVELLELDPADPCRLVCGDSLGQLYFLSWRQ